ncbi:MAG: hypothetical protein KDB16_17230 [Acidimicrobiales bacterium]|nr:hypothetical protein [Acidimicrobiales bacterium]
MAGSATEGLRLGVLGPLIAFDSSGAEVVLPSATLRRLAAVLVSYGGAVVSLPFLADVLSVSPAAVRTSIARLRRLIGSDVVATAAIGYRLVGAQTDVGRFRHAVETEGNPGDRLATLEAALELWRGDAYAEFASEPWALAEVVQLSEMRSRAELEVADIHLEEGRGMVALERLAHLIHRDPFSDAPRATRIRALTVLGRTAEATREYESYRQLLDQEVGVAPSASLTRLVQSILAGDSDAVEALRPRVAAVARRGAPNRPAQLPRPPTPLVGRQSEVAQVRGLVFERSLVTLTGPGGVGKTRIAQHVAMEVAASGTEVVWVDLAVVGSDDLVAEAVLAVLAPAAPPGRDPMTALSLEASTRDQMLVVLDNAEHVANGASSVVSTLVDCGVLCVLATSRVRLGLTAEREYLVRPLGLPPATVEDAAELEKHPATALFLNRVEDAGGSVEFDPGSVAAVVAICRRLDGIPLAIEFAAAHARHLPLAKVLEGLYGPVSLLTVDNTDTTPRHRTIERSIEWSISLLSDDQASALECLAVFNAPFVLDAATAVIGDRSTRGRDLLVALVDRNLVQFDPGSGRYRLLELVREYVDRRCDPAQRRQARTRHMEYFTQWATDVGAGRRGIRREPVLAEMQHVVTAMAWARENDPRSAFAICAGLASFRSTLGHHRELADTWNWLVTTEFDADLRPAWAEATASLLAAATGAQIDVTDVLPIVAACVPEDSSRARGWLNRGTAMVPAYRGNMEPICSYVDQVIERGDDPEVSVYAGFAVYMLAMSGQLDRADTYLAAVKAMIERHRTEFTVDSVGNGFAGAIHVELARGRWGTALSAVGTEMPADPAFTATAAAAIAQAGASLGRTELVDLAVRWSERGTLQILGFLEPLVRHYAASIRGDVAGSADAAEAFWEMAYVVPISHINQVGTVVSALVAAGRLDAARSAIDTASSAVAAMNEVPLLSCLTHWSEALLELSYDRHAKALAVGRQALEAAIGHGFALVMIDSLEVLALAATGVGRTQIAASLAAAAARERKRTGYVRSQVAGMPNQTDLARIAAGAETLTVGDLVAQVDRALEA